MTRTHKFFTLLVIVCFVFTSITIFGCAENFDKTEIQAVLQELRGKSPKADIYFKQYPAGAKKSKKVAAWIAFFEEGRDLGFFEIRERGKGNKAFIIGYLKDKHRAEVGYKSPHNNYSQRYTIVPGKFTITEIEELAFREDKDIDLKEVKLSYKKKFEPNKLGELLLKYGLLSIKEEEVGKIILQKTWDADKWKDKYSY